MAGLVVILMSFAFKLFMGIGDQGAEARKGERRRGGYRMNRSSCTYIPRMFFLNIFVFSAFAVYTFQVKGLSQWAWDTFAMGWGHGGGTAEACRMDIDFGSSHAWLRIRFRFI